MKILLIGAKGQLGDAIQREMTMHSIVGVDLPEVDITNLNMVREVVRHHAPDLVLNSAAYTNVDGAEVEVETAYRANSLGPKNIALATEQQKIPLLHISTDYVFDGYSSRPYHEFDRPNPLSVYGASKLAGEEVIRAINPQHFIVRTAWLYHTVGKNFPKTMCTLSSKPEVRVVNDQFGSPTFAPHLAKGLLKLMETEAYGTYHGAGKGRASWFDLTQTLFRDAGISTKVSPVSTSEFPRPAPRPYSSVLTTIQDPSLDLPPWEEGVKEFVQEMKSARAHVA